MSPAPRPPRAEPRLRPDTREPVRIGPVPRVAADPGAVPGAVAASVPVAGEAPPVRPAGARRPHSSQ